MVAGPEAWVAKAGSEVDGGVDPRVGVLAADPETRERVCAALTASGAPPAARAGEVAGLLHRLGGAAPSCIVVGARRPDAAAEASVAALRRAARPRPASPASPLPPLVLVSERAGRADVRRALELGFEGVVLAERIEATLAVVVAAVSAGHTAVPSRHRVAVGSRELTTREKQILALVAAGLTNAQIAAHVFLAESTVKSHLSSAFSKLNVASRHEAATLVLDPERSRAFGIPLPQPTSVAAGAGVGR